MKEQDCMYSTFQSKVTGLAFVHLNVYSAFVQTEPTGGMDLGFRVGAYCLQRFSLQCEHLKYACGGVVCVRRCAIYPVAHCQTTTQVFLSWEA